MNTSNYAKRIEELEADKRAFPEFDREERDVLDRYNRKGGVE